MEGSICLRCGAQLGSDTVATCPYCHADLLEDTPGEALYNEARAALERGEVGRALQLIESSAGGAADPRLNALKAQAESELSALKRGEKLGAASAAAFSEAEQYHSRANFILIEAQANVQVYGSNSGFSTPNPANIDLGLQYINRSLELFPDSPVYLNTKALLLVDGLGRRDEAVQLLERAAELAPRDITIQNNLNGLKSSTSNCFIATAAYGTPFNSDIDVLRKWRDDVLARSKGGRFFMRQYYRLSPPIAEAISRHETAKSAVRAALRPLVSLLSARYRP